MMQIFVKGDWVLYHNKAAQSSSQTSHIVVKVLGVHFDDMPNIYYTIMPLDPSQCNFDEKQTDADRLRNLTAEETEAAKVYGVKMKEDAASAAADRMLKITANFNKKDIQILVEQTAKVSELKEAISEKTGLSAKEMKITYKGNVLKDDSLTMVECQLTKGCKISVAKIKSR